MAEGTRQTEEELEVLRRMAAGKTSPTYTDLARALTRALEHIDVLTPPTPEEVARDYETVRESLVTLAMGAHQIPDDLAALGRLRDWAAQGRAMEVRNAQDAALLEARKGELAAALSERDALRAQVEDLGERVEGLISSLKASLANTEEAEESRKRLADGLATAADDAEQCRAQVETLRGERDAARQEAETLDAQRLSTEEALTTAGVSVDDGLHEGVRLLVRECATLRAQVATLERDLGEIRKEREEHCDDSMSFERMYQAEKARAEAAEKEAHRLSKALALEQTTRDAAVAAREAAEAERDAYKRDLQAQLDGNGALRKELGAKDSEIFPDFVRRLAAEREAAKRRVAELEAHVKRIRAHRETAEGLPEGTLQRLPIAGKPATTPAPAGLLEAVGTALEACPCSPDAQCPRCHILSPALAAYEAAKGGEALSVALVALDKAMAEKTLREARDLRRIAAALTRAGVPRVVVLKCEEKHGRRRDVLHRVLWLIEGWESLRRKDAAKGGESGPNWRKRRNYWRRRFKDEQAIIREWQWAADSGGVEVNDTDDLTALARDARKYREACERVKDRELFARLMREAMGPLFSDAANSWSGMGEKAREQWTRSVDAASRFLGLTPDAPTPEGGGQPACPCTGGYACQPECEGCELTATPKPTSAAPDVVWEGRGVRVWADGTVQMANDEEWSEHIKGCVQQVARALAEAKRDAARAKECLEAARGIVEANVISVNNFVAVAQRKAAEDMRERCAQVLLARRDQLLGRPMTDGRRRGLEEGAAIVRTLPLEAQ